MGFEFPFQPARLGRGLSCHADPAAASFNPVDFARSVFRQQPGESPARAIENAHATVVENYNCNVAAPCNGGRDGHLQNVFRPA